MAYDTAHYAPALWSRVRDDYLSGDSAEAVCARHGVSRSQLFAQARAGGWRRSDLPVAAMGASDAEPDDGAPAPPTAELAGEALRLGARAVTRGRLHEAQGWVALAARLRALAKDECDFDGWRGFLPTTPAAEPPAPARAAGPEAPAPRTPPPDDAAELAEAVNRLVGDAGELCRRMEAGEDVEAQAHALNARVGALEARWAPPGPAADTGGGWEWPRETDGPAGLPPGAGVAGVSGAAMAAALGWEAPTGGARARAKAASSACLPAAAPPAGGRPSRRPPSAP